MTDVKSTDSTNTTHANSSQEGKSSDMSNVLKHIKDLEEGNTVLKQQLKEALERNGKLSAKTREGMQSALDTLMKKWMDAVETKDEKIKDDFKSGLEKLVKNSNEDNGVWQMMVSASALHQQQEHNLEKLRGENSELKRRLDDTYGSSEARTGSTGKRLASTELSRADVEAEKFDIWEEFTNGINY